MPTASFVKATNKLLGDAVGGGGAAFDDVELSSGSWGRGGFCGPGPWAGNE
ncbi:MAG: hypothetical protein JOY54_11640 [Acidobacteriaceae bacterium]|nr:hypothetical protein [Acidobacteriaceae bacterium]